MCNNTNEMKFLTIEWKKMDSVKRQKTDLADSGFLECHCGIVSSGY